MPPVAEMIWLYGMPTLPFAKLAFAMASGVEAGALPIWNNTTWEALAPVLSVTEMLAARFCTAAVGVPLRTPAILRVKPAGNPEAEKVYGATPALAVKV